MKGHTDQAGMVRMLSGLALAVLILVFAFPAHAVHTLVTIRPMSEVKTGSPETRVKVERLKPFQRPSALPPEKPVPDEDEQDQELETEPIQTPQKEVAEGEMSSPAEVLYNQARFDVIGRDYTAADEKLDQAARLEPENVRILTLKARVAKALGRPDEALVGYRALMAKPGAEPSLGFEAADLLASQKRYDEALDQYRKIEETDQVRSLKSRAEILIKLWRFSRAVKVLSTPVEAPARDRQELLFLRGKALYWNRNYEEALVVLTRAKVLDPESDLVGKIGEMAESIRRDDRPWYAGVSTTLMYDSDVFLDPDYDQPANAVTSGRSDGAFQADVWLGSRIVRSQGVSLGAIFQAQYLTYFKETEANWSYFSPGLYLAKTNTEWGFRLPYAFYYYYSSQDFRDNSAIHSLNPSLYWQITPKFLTQVYGYFQVKKFFEKDSDSLYYSLGASHRLTLNKSTNYLSLSYQYSLEDHEDDESGYQGFEATFSGGYEIVDSVNFYGSLTGAYYDYNTRPEWTLDYAVVDRNDFQIRLYAQVSWAVHPTWYLNLGYNFIWNDSDVSGDGIAPYDYNKSTVAFRITKTF